MKQEIKQKWIAALLSGDYRQTVRVLRSDIGGEPRFCALGVLCDVIDPNAWEGEGGTIISWKGEFAMSNSTLEEIGLSDNNEAAIVLMNDHDNFSFERIAQYIRDFL